MSVNDNPYVRAVDDVVVCDSPGRRHRAFPTAVRLPNDDVLVGYRVGSDHHMTLDGAFYLTRSRDNGRTWSTPIVHTAIPGWDVCANIAQYPDGVMPDDEPFLYALLRQYRWVPEPGPEEGYRQAISFWSLSHDLGYTWEPSFPLYEETVAEVQTDRGPMKFWGLTPHTYSSTLHRLADGRIMGLFCGRTDPTPYRSRAEGTASTQPPDWVLAGFSSDNLRTWTYRVIADSSGGIGFSEGDLVRLDNGRFVAIYGNNAGSPYFFETHSDDEGQTWSPMRQLDFRGDSPSMIRLTGNRILAAIRHMPEAGNPGIGLVISPDGGQSWQNLGNAVDQSMWDMGYPDLVRLADGRILCVYYTASEKQPISDKLAAELASREPMATIFAGGIRPAAFGEIQSEIRALILEEING